jgi:hypothetical protein
VSDNFFQGNDTAVEVTCTSLTGDCAPVVSPHNRFVGDAQLGIINTHPQDVCVEARFNWWGDVSGPQDSSSEQDACQLVDNPGSGATSSDGVDYSPWDGGLARPIIAQPGCGVTGRSQPTFTGRSYDGATVSFYDGQVLLGQTIAASDHTFSWTPTEPISDGLHTITAAATLSDETSLPSPELLLTIDSTLPFDPAGVLISYDFHDQIYTQRLKDSSGCSSVIGDLDTSFWVRPDTTLSVIIPVRIQTSNPVISFDNKDISQPTAESNHHIAYSTGITVTFSVDNQSKELISKIFVAPKINGRVYESYGDENKIDYIAHTKTATISMEPGEYEVSYWGEGNRLIYREQRVFTNENEHTMINPADYREIKIENDSGKNFTAFYLVTSEGLVVDNNFGANFVSTEKPLSAGERRTYFINWDSQQSNVYHAVFVAQDGTNYIRQINLSKITTKLLKFDKKDSEDAFKFINDSTDEVCSIRLVRNDDVSTWKYLGSPPNLLSLLNRTVKPGEEIIIKLEQGRYSLVVESCDTEGNPKKEYEGHFRNLNQPWTFWGPCVEPGQINLGTIMKELKCPNQQTMIGSTNDAFVGCYAADIPFSVGNFIIRICLGGVEYETHVGQGLIDPDGYVYDAVWGIESVIPGATVTCDVYDEDYQSWERWPAELYEAQINPQVTGMDGYYAFFVPPGLYRVRAVAGGYDPHTSPDIRVIDEIVHYNIPMTGGGGIFLPFVIR